MIGERALNGSIKGRPVPTGTYVTMKETKVTEDNLNRRIEDPKRDCNTDNQAEGSNATMSSNYSPTVNNIAPPNNDKFD